MCADVCASRGLELCPSHSVCDAGSARPDGRSAHDRKTTPTTRDGPTAGAHRSAVAQTGARETMSSPAWSALARWTHLRASWWRGGLGRRIRFRARCASPRPWPCTAASSAFACDPLCARSRRKTLLHAFGAGFGVAVISGSSASKQLRVRASAGPRCKTACPHPASRARDVTPKYPSLPHGVRAPTHAQRKHDAEQRGKRDARQDEHEERAEQQ